METAVILIIMANKTSSGLKKQLNLLNFKCQTKSKLHKPRTRPISTYWGKCWFLWKKDGSMLRIFEWKIL